MFLFLHIPVLALGILVAGDYNCLCKLRKKNAFIFYIYAMEHPYQTTISELRFYILHRLLSAFLHKKDKCLLLNEITMNNIRIINFCMQKVALVTLVLV